jgi:DNA-binding NtrC family response regulator
VLVVEDEPALSEILGSLLAREGYEVGAAATAEEALALIEGASFDLLLTDLLLPGVDGIELLEKLRARDPGQTVIVMTAHPTLDSAVRALRAGAFDYIVKPVIEAEIKRTVRAALEVRALRAENDLLQREIRAQWDVGQVVGKSEELQPVLAEMRAVADSRSNVLLLGETGTGKELVARAIHHLGSRRAGPFVPINCSAVPESLLESELFGYQRGAFSGAAGAKRGLLEEADGGTVFFDEIGEMSPLLQSKLLRVIDDRQIRPLGAVQSRQVDIRFIAATNVDIRRAIAGGSFREDLYYRLSVVTLTLPPLRRRTGDVPLLARHFLSGFAHELGRPVSAIEPAAMRILEAHSWPGNVRELRNVIERAVLIAAGPEIRPVDLPAGLATAPHPALPPAQSCAGGPAVRMPALSIEEYTRQLIVHHQRARSEQEIASMLGITRKALWEKRKRWGLRRV